MPSKAHTREDAMRTTGFSRPRNLGSSWLCAAVLSALTLGAAVNASAQNTLPLPTPGTTPAAPAAPAGGDNAARTRAQALAAKANVDITEAWTKATTNA